MAQENQVPVVDQGSGLTTVDVDPAVPPGTGADTYTAGNIFQKADLFRKVWVNVMTFDARLVLFTSAAGAEQDERILLVGVYEIEMANYGGKIRNRTAGSNTSYEIWWER